MSLSSFFTFHFLPFFVTIMKHFLLFFLFCGMTYGQGTLKEAKERLDSPPITSSGSEEHYTSTDGSYQVHSAWDDITFLPMLLDLTFILGYNLLVESSYERYGRMRTAELNPYPYYKGKERFAWVVALEQHSPTDTFGKNSVVSPLSIWILSPSQLSIFVFAPSE